MNKLVWKYILDNCECWGEWKPDEELVNFFIGEQVDLTSCLKEFNSGKDRVIVLTNGNWFVKDFPSFQYGELSETCNAHKPVIENLKRMDVYGYLKGTLRVQDKDKEKETKKREQEYFKDSKFTDIYQQYLSMRKKINKPATPHAEKLIIDLLHKYDLKTAIAMLEQSIVNSWQGVFPLKRTEFKSNEARQLVPDAKATQEYLASLK